jgi:hypothetical protein
LQRLLNVLSMLIVFELGVLLVFLPWSNLWERNYFIAHYPVLRPYLLHPAVRGAISGLGALDILIAGSMLRRRSSVPRAHNA